MKKKPSAEYVLLGALMRGPKHGYEIQHFLDAALGATWRVGMSQIYAVLKRLEGEHLLQSSVKQQDTKPSKRVFSITSRGEGAFLDWLHSPAEHVRDLRIEFLARLFFFRHLKMAGGRRLVAAQAQVLEGAEKRLRKRLRAEKDLFNRLVIEFKIVTVETWYKWLVEQAASFVSAIRAGDARP